MGFNRQMVLLVCLDIFGVVASHMCVFFNGVFNIGAGGQQILHMAQSFVGGKKDFLVLYVIFFEERAA